MENYRKGKNVEEPLERSSIPIPNLPENFLWMHVKGGSKIRLILTYALNKLPIAKSVVWTAFGPAVGKAITCAEIMKKQYNNSLHQITKICYRLIEEYWDPLIPELEQLVVKRKLPMVHILLSIDPVNSEELGYQAPGTITPFPNIGEGGNKHSPRKQKGFQLQNETPTREFAAMGMGNKKNLYTKKRSKNKKSTTLDEEPSSSSKSDT